MPVEITMPQLSDTMTEGTLVKWNKKEGDKVASGEEIAEIETDKATMPMEAFDSGTLAVILAKAGDKVKVGDAIGVIATGSDKIDEIKKKYEAGQAAKPAEAAGAKAETPAAKAPAKAEAAKQENSVAATETRSATAVAAPASNGSSNGSEGDENHGDRLFITPLAKRIAAERNIDPQSLRGSGPGGRIVKQDVLSFVPPIATLATAAGAAAPMGSGDKQVVPLTKMRLAIAKNLLASKQNIPHFYETIDVDVEDLSKLRGRLNEMLEAEKVRLSLGDLIAKAVTVALMKHPALNAIFNGTEITRYGDVHLGMAVAIPDGLIVPVLRNIHLLGLKEIRRRSVDLIDRARGQRLKQEEMSGATFTVSNLGTFGIREFSAIINPPQVAILAIAAAEKRAIVRNDQIVARTMITLTLSADHRVVDGATAADFLRTLKGLLEEPAMMLA